MTGTTRTVTAALAAALVVAAVAACDFFGLSGPSGPGELHATLVSPNGEEGAAVFELTGGVGLGSVVTDSGQVFYQHDGGTTRVVVVLDAPGQIQFRVRTEDVGELPDVALVEVADGDNELRGSLSGYEVEFVQVEDPLATQRRGPQ